MANKKNLYKDSRGAALVYVIVAAAIIVLLGAATTVAAISNLQSTQIQKISDNNFFSADTVMNAIVSGLEGDISKAYDAAYTETMTNIQKNTLNDSEEMFKELFLTDLQNILKDDNGLDSFYSVNHIQQYVTEVDKIFKDDIRFTVSAVNNDNHLDITDSALILRNLHVTYEDDNGYFDEITTDVKVKVPKFIGVAPDITTADLNSFVFDDGLSVTTGHGLHINGNTYINKNGDSVANKNDKNVIWLENGSSLNIMTPNELIAGGHIETDNNTILNIAPKTDGAKNGIAYPNKFWTENIEFGRYTNSTIGAQTFVYDDMELNGSNSKVALSGEYWGYNKNGTNASESSSININGAHSSLSMKDLSILMLAGSSYVSTSTVDPTATGAKPEYVNSTDLQMGEAFSVKSNQIAYLVSDKDVRLGTPGADGAVAKFNSNPMSYKQYEEMLKANNGWENTKNKILNTRLSNQKSYADYNADIIHVFSGKDDGTAYLYLKFADPKDAAHYFVEAYTGDSILSNKLRTYAAEYLQRLELGDSQTLMSNNYVNDSIKVYTDRNTGKNGEVVMQTNPNGLGYNHDKSQEMDEKVAALRDAYLGNADKNIEGEKHKRTYEKLVNQEKLVEFITQATAAMNDQTLNPSEGGVTGGTHDNTNNKIITIPNGVIMHGTNSNVAVLVNNKNKDPLVINKDFIKKCNGSNSGMIIASGKVTVDHDWVGTIIAGGRVISDGMNQSRNTPITLTTDEDAVASVLPLYFVTKQGDKTKTMSVFNVLKGFENVHSNPATNDSGINADMLSNCLTFTNWNRY